LNFTHIHGMLLALIFLILLAAFFSAAEIGMMSINRYRLRHLVRKKNRAAKRVSELLERPDRLLGVILIGNNFATILASSLATVIAVHWYGEVGVGLAAIVLTFVMLIFSDITPKTLAALYPQQIAFAFSLVLKFLLTVCYPIVWFVNGIANGLLRLFGIKLKRGGLDALSHEELRTIVHEATGKTLSGYQGMLISILDLANVTVEDIMIPRNEIMGIDLNQNWESILEQLTESHHTRLPLYKESIDHVEGVLHLRHALNLLASKKLNKETLIGIASEPYFVPEGTALNIQLINFQQEKSRSALVVDEYGDIQGLITLEDILEEIVGEFTTNLSTAKNVRRNRDGSYTVNGGAMVRELNRNLDWDLPTRGAKTLSGIIVEYLEMFPQTGLCLRLADYPMEILEVEENMVKTVRIWPKLRFAQKG
jgi:Mg2+/Co2+ transporter CorB